MEDWTKEQTATALACRFEIGGIETVFGAHTKIAWNGTNAACPTDLVLGPNSGRCISTYNQKVERDDLAGHGLGAITARLDAFEKEFGMQSIQ